MKKIYPLLLSAGLLAQLDAETLAYWRFEEATSGEVPASTAGGAVPNTLLDSSGNGNHMQTWTTATAPGYSVQLAPPAGTLAGVAGTGALNRASLDFNGKPQDIYTANKPLNTKQFQAWTIEASFQLDVTGAWQVIVGKDGNPVGGQSPLSMKVRADNKLEIGVVDGSGVAKWVVGTTRIEAGKWYHAAATATLDTLSLWLKPAGADRFIAQGSTSISGAFFNSYSALNQPWIVGRGMWNGKQADWTNGRIDEVRISDTALAPAQFLGSYADVDSDEDGLPDAWELVYFRENASESDSIILAKQSSPDEDPDGDGFSNFIELTYGLDPANVEDLTGKLTREVWFGVPGGLVSDLTSYPGYYSKNRTLELHDGMVLPENYSDAYGQRVRGWITAPVSGDYTFWISGDDQCEMWLSTSGSKFDKQLIANVSGWTAPQQWNKFPSQRSVPVTLVAGQRYFFECLHKEDGLTDHLSIAWQIPGSQSEVVPSEHLTPYIDDPFDKNMNELPDDWEVTHGFSLSTEGSANPDQHPLADPDHDGYSNLEESVYGTDPTVRGGVPGSLLLETWNNIGGANVENLTWSGRYTGAPDRSEFIFTAETPVNRADNFGARMRGYVIAPESGDYVFYLAGDDNCELWLSPSESQFAKQKIASVDGWTNVRQWTKYSAQTSVSIPLAAGQKYYIEALQKESTGGDHMEIGWRAPGSTSIAVIPGSHLESYAYDANDADGDNMPDDWEALHGLVPSRNDAAEDPDRDAIPNHLEWSSNGDPQVKGTIQGGLLQELWWNVPGKMIGDFTSSARYHALADARQIIPSSESASSLGENYGKRVRGYLTAPVTGDYTFWITSDDSSVLLLSDGESKYNRTAIASVSGYVNPKAWDTFLSQKSRSIHLVAGQRYYIEALHKELIGSDHLAIAWQKPGGVRELIPCSALSTYAPTADDLDDNDLPDSWQIANGIPVDPTRSNPAHGFYGDLDGDGLTNADEWKAGTRPDLVDTDGDGVSDFDEVRLLESSPLTADAAPFESLFVIPGASYGATSGEWTQESGAARQACVRGWVEYPVSLPIAGIYQLNLAFTPVEDIGVCPDYEIVFSVDGKTIQRETITVAEIASGHAQILMPWLSEGSHAIRVFIDNSYQLRRVTVDQLEVLAARGTDTNANGTPDWVEQSLANRNSFEAPAESYTSPVCLEGKTRWTAMSTVAGLPVEAAPNDRWFANVPLNPAQPTNITASLENGGVVETQEVIWKPVNVLSITELAIRQGDSLRLTAFVGAEATSAETVNVTVDGQTSNIQADQPIIHEFSTPGVFTVLATHSLNGNASTATLTVNVVAAPEIESPVCVLGSHREVDIPALPNGVSLQLDDRIDIQGTTTYSAGSVKHILRLNTLDDRPALFRLGGANGPIIASLPFRAMRVRDGQETAVYFEAELGGNAFAVAMPVLVDGLHPDVSLEYDIFIGGVTFDDGTLRKALVIPDHFTPDGEHILHFLKSGTSGSNCHRLSVWQNGKRIAYRQ